MTTTVTNSFGRIFLDELLDSSSNFYAVLAGPNSFVEPTNISSQKFQMQTRHGLIAAKIISGVSYVVPLVEWASGTVYSQYNNEDDSQTNFYVVNSNREVFLCVEQGKIPTTSTATDSIVEPTASAGEFSPKTFATSDGYKWRYLYRISNLAYGTFKTNAFMPVKKMVDRNTLISEEIQQLFLQDSSISGEILGIYIDSGGTGYTNTPTISITGNGTGGSFSAEINNGKIVAVRVDSDFVNGGFNHGSGYEYAKIDVSTGDAALRPIFGPYNGTAADPTMTLKANSIMFQTQFEEDEAGTILTNDNFFHQVALMKNLKKYNSDSDFSGNSGNGLKILSVTSVTDRTGFSGTFFTPDETIFGKFVAFDSDAGNLLYYYQNDSTGFGIFESGDTIQCNGETASVTGSINPDFNAYSGDILYINNLNNPIDRSTGQIEDVRIVIRMG